jgi:hypothetical protein
MVDGVSLRKAAKRCRIDLGTLFRWRHRFLMKPKGLKAKSVEGIVEVDETFFRRSAKWSPVFFSRLDGDAQPERVICSPKAISQLEAKFASGRCPAHRRGDQTL